MHTKAVALGTNKQCIDVYEISFASLWESVFNNTACRISPKYNFLNVLRYLVLNCKDPFYQPRQFNIWSAVQNGKSFIFFLKYFWSICFPHYLQFFFVTASSFFLWNEKEHQNWSTLKYSKQQKINWRTIFNKATIKEITKLYNIKFSPKIPSWNV